MSATVVDVVIVGGGIVGLSTMLRLLERDPSTKAVLLEKDDRIAGHQTGHNSGVIHSGIYYKPGSNKAKTCTAGRSRLIDFCESNDVDYEICGKVIVAAAEREIPRLEALETRSIANGVSARRIGLEELNELEPHAVGVGGLYVPEAGITNYRAVATKMAGLIIDAGGKIVTNAEVTKIVEKSEGVRVSSSVGDFWASNVTTCGGLQSDRLARQTVPETTDRIMPFRGEYFELAEHRRHLVNNLIYPVPSPDFPFLGVHLTRMIDGSVHAGPNAVLALAREGYTWGDVDLSEMFEVLTNPGWWKLARSYWKTGMGEYYRSLSKRAFVKSLQGLIPEITADDLVPSPAGVRAQAVSRNGNLLDDFVWSESRRVVNVINAPSPAATAAFSVGDQIVDRLQLHLS